MSGAADFREAIKDQIDREADLMRKMVQDRVSQEAAAAAPSEEPPKITSQLIRDCLLANELGDGRLYATLHRDRFLFVKNMQEWLMWNGHYWIRDTMDRSLAAVEEVAALYLTEYKSLALDIAERSAAGAGPDSDEIKQFRSLQTKLLKRVSQLRGENRRSACLKFAHTMDNPLAIAGEELDAKPWLFPCKNGVIDLQTGRLKPGLPGDYLYLASPVEFRGIDEPAPLWEKSLLEIFNGNTELVAYLQRLFGYSMTGIVNEKVFPVLYGKTGWNGRSMIVETINYAMGKLAGSIQSEMLLSQRFAKSSSGPSPDIMSLKGVRLAFASEIEDGQRFSASRIKQLTGNDELNGRNPHDKYPTRFKPSHKLIVMTNTQPAAPAHDQAFWERLQLIPFEISFVKRDPLQPHERRANLNLGRDILKEAPGILAWLVRGCLLWQLHGLNPPLAVTEASKKYQRNEDMLADWIDECCLLEPGARGKSAVLYNRFVDWYHENVGQKEPTGTWLGKQLGQKFEKQKSNGSVYYLGIDLKLQQGELGT